MRVLTPPQQPYKVDIAPLAWSQLGAVPSTVFRRIRQELDALAALGRQRPLPSLEPLQEAGLCATLSLLVEDFVVLCEVEPERRTITLLEVVRRLSPSAR